MSDFEAILQDVGDFGPFQVRLFILVSMFETPAAWAMFLPVFVSANPSWRCPLNCSDVNVTCSSSDNVTYRNTSDGTCDGPDVCKDIEYTSGFTSIVSEVCIMDLSWCRLEVGDPPALALLPVHSTFQWNLMCGLDFVPSLITTVQMVGVLLGACIIGQLADTYGRRHIFYAVYTLMLVSGLVSAFSSCWQMYLAFRFLIGTFFGGKNCIFVTGWRSPGTMRKLYSFPHDPSSPAAFCILMFVTGTMVINFVLPMEYVGRQWRTFCGCIGFWACGVMTLAPMAYFIRDWRQLTMAAALGGIFLLFSWR